MAASPLTIIATAAGCTAKGELRPEPVLFEIPAFLRDIERPSGAGAGGEVYGDIAQGRLCFNGESRQ
jgi:hypothetical protein